MRPRALLYLDVERAGLMSYPALQETIEAYTAWARPSLAAGGGERLFLLLDEVTAIPRWSTALKALHAAGAWTVPRLSRRVQTSWTSDAAEAPFRPLRFLPARSQGRRGS